MSTTEPQKPTYNEQPPPYDASQPPVQAQVAYPQQPVAPGAAYPPPGQRGVTTTTVVTQPAVGVIMPIVFGPHPVSMTCPHCQAMIVTNTTYQPGLLTWLVCGGIALVGFWCGCCFIPFCMDDMQDCQHSCPNCKNYLGTYRRM